MASSWTLSSRSPDGLLDEPTRVDASRTSTDGGDGEAKRVTSLLRSQETLGSICKKYSIPDSFDPILAGDLSSCSLPPPGSVCVHVDALDAGMRLPLHPFYGEVLSHFGIAPSQLAPNGWLPLAGFVVLSHFAGEAPSLAVFRYFFSLCPFGVKNKLYSFRGKDAVGLLFGRLNTNSCVVKGWKEEFFFLSSSAPWPCPVQWGVPSKSATFGPTLTGQEKGVADKLLRARGDCPIDLTRYLHEGNMAAAKIIRPAAPLPSPTPQGMVEAPVSVIMEALGMEAEKACASAGKVTVKTEPGLECDAPPCAPSLGKKRKLAEDRQKSESWASDISCPPGFSKPLMPPATSKDCGKEQRGGDTRDWEAARKLLQGIVTPSREHELAASKPAKCRGFKLRVTAPDGERGGVFAGIRSRAGGQVEGVQARGRRAEGTGTRRRGGGERAAGGAAGGEGRARGDQGGGGSAGVEQGASKRAGGAGAVGVRSSAARRT